MRSRHPRLVKVLPGLALVVAAAACASTEEPAHRTAATTTAADIRPGGTLVHASTIKLSGFNQSSPRSASLLLANLMLKVWPSAFASSPDGTAVLNRDLLDSAELTSSDPQTVVYRINPKATWSDGDPIDAKDFAYLWRTAYTRGAKDVDGSPIASTKSDVHGVIESVTPSDGDRTVTVVFARRYPDWRSLFSYLAPSHVAERVGWNAGFNTFDPAVVVSGGPFRIADHRPDQDVTLVRNERFWGRPANLESIVVRILPDPTQVLAALKNGEIDLADLRNPSVDMLSQARALDRVETLVYPEARYQRLYFNFRSRLTGLPAVRRAVALAIDRPGVLARGPAQLDPAMAKITNNRLYAPDEKEYRDTSGGRYDRQGVDGAKRLLEAEGFQLGGDGIYARGGERLSLRYPTSAMGSQLAELLQAQLRPAGIELRIEQVPDALEALRTGTFDLAGNSRPTSPSARSSETTQFVTDGGFNYGKYSNPVVDDLLRQANSELDHARRVDLHRRADEVMWEDMPTLPLQQVIAVVVHHDRFANIVPQPSAALFESSDRWGVRAGT